MMLRECVFLLGVTSDVYGISLHHNKMYEDKDFILWADTVQDHAATVNDQQINMVTWVLHTPCGREQYV